MRSRCRWTGWGVGVDRAEQNRDGCWMMMKNVILRGRGGGYVMCAGMGG